MPLRETQLKNAQSDIESTHQEITKSFQEQDVVVEETQIIETITVNILEEPVHCDQTDRPKPKKELPKQSALGALMKDIHQEVVAKDEKKVELTEETLPLLWKEFLNEFRDKLQNAFMSVAEKQSPQLIGEKIVFTETNNISLELLQLHKMDILAYFRKKTTASSSGLEFKLHKKESKQKNYRTPKERLKDMIVDNPSILKLIEKLDLNEY